MKTRSWIVFFAGLVAALVLVWKLLPDAGGETVGVYQDGKLLMTISLSQEQTFEIPGPAGGNTICVSEEGVRVTQAGCPDKLCVAHGVLKAGQGPIICLPNRLVIRFLRDARADGVDAVAGGRSLP